MKQSGDKLEIELNKLARTVYISMVAHSRFYCSRENSVHIFELEVHNHNYAQAVVQLQQNQLKINSNISDIMAVHPLTTRN